MSDWRRWWIELSVVNEPGKRLQMSELNEEEQMSVTSREAVPTPTILAITILLPTTLLIPIHIYIHTPVPTLIPFPATTAITAITTIHTALLLLLLTIIIIILTATPISPLRRETILIAGALPWIIRQFTTKLPMTDFWWSSWTM